MTEAGLDPENPPQTYGEVLEACQCNWYIKITQITGQYKVMQINHGNITKNHVNKYESCTYIPQNGHIAKIKIQATNGKLGHINSQIALSHL